MVHPSSVDLHTISPNHAHDIEVRHRFYKFCTQLSSRRHPRMPRTHSIYWWGIWYVQYSRRSHQILQLWKAFLTAPFKRTQRIIAPPPPKKKIYLFTVPSFGPYYQKKVTKKLQPTLKLRQDPPWFEFLVIFDFFAPWCRRGWETSSVKIL